MQIYYIKYVQRIVTHMYMSKHNYSVYIIEQCTLVLLPHPPYMVQYSIFCLPQNGVTVEHIAQLFGWDKIVEELYQPAAKQTKPQELSTSQERSAPYGGRTFSQVHEYGIVHHL